VITFAADGKTLNPIAPDEREWALFFIFGIADGEQDPENWDTHVDWLSARFADPDDWLGPEGDTFRVFAWHDPSDEFVRRWRRFQAAHASDSLDEIDRLLAVLLFDA